MGQEIAAVLVEKETANLYDEGEGCCNEDCFTSPSAATKIFAFSSVVGSPT